LFINLGKLDVEIKEIMRLGWILFFSIQANFCQFLMAAPKSIRINVEDAAAPWSIKDGTGYANDLVVAAYKAMGITAELIVVPYARCKREVMEAREVACFSMSYEPQLKGKVIFSEKPLFVFNSDFYYNVKKPMPAENESEIKKGRIVGIVKGYEYPQSINDLASRGIILDAGYDEESNLRKLALGRIDYTLINHNAIKPSSDLVDRIGLKDQIKFAFHGGALNSYIGFSANHPDGAWAREQFDKGYAKIMKSGEMKKIEIVWLKKLNAK
jgi:polar amino acid transport system substrate-binding protein